MEKVLKQYKTCAMACLELGIILQFFVIDVLFQLPGGNTVPSAKAQVFILFFATQSTLYLLLAALPLHWFEKSAWKRLNRDLDFDGEWHYWIRYYPPDKRNLAQEAQTKCNELLTHLQENHGTAQIKQTCFGLSLEEGVGQLGGGPRALKTTWTARSITITKEAGLVIHFRSNLGGVAFDGIDDLTVHRVQSRPTTMTGHFRMYSDGYDLTIKGEIVYSREPSVGSTYQWPLKTAEIRAAQPHALTTK
jgi:hypothetical protein